MILGRVIPFYNITLIQLNKVYSTINFAAAKPLAVLTRAK
jgi:hypothetical protein